ncbi:MAG: FtsK/SpoIIIE domain-containing protein [Chloroflexota bacterium]
MREQEIIHQIQTQVNRLARTAAEVRRYAAQAVEDAEAQSAQKLSQAEEEYRQAMAQEQARSAEAARQAEERLAEIEAIYRQQMEAAAAPYPAALSQALESLAPASALLERRTWEDPAWRSWEPPDALVGLPPASRLGWLTYTGRWDQIGFPAIPPLIGGRPLLIEASGLALKKAAAAIQSYLLRLLVGLPPGKLYFTFLDPLGLGQNAAPFMKLADYNELLVSSRAWTEPQHIERQLAALTEHMENVIQKYLRSHYAAIEEYNEEAGEVAEPYRLLAAYNFPANFNEAAARRLLSIAQNGPRCGVYAVILADPSKPSPHGFNLNDLRQACSVISWQEGGGFVWKEPVFVDCQLELDEPPETELFNALIEKIGQTAQEAGKVEVPFDKVLERAGLTPASWQRAKAGDGLRVPLGPSGARKAQILELGAGVAQHALVAGRTGAGKSTLLHVLITSLALAYSPDEVTLYLIDFKKGVEFKPYAEIGLPHARVIAIESEREFGLSVLQGLDAEMKRRGDLFRAAMVDDLASYRRKSRQQLGRILLIVDEFQEFFTEDDVIASQAMRILDRLVRQGRGFGMHVLLGSQTLAGAYTLARSTIDQMAVRIALQCSEADSRLILADDNPSARLLTRPGEAIYNAANGRVEGNNHFQVAWLPDEERDRYLLQISELVNRTGYQSAAPTIVFEGNLPGDVAKNSLLKNLLSERPAPASSGDFARDMLAWLGEPIAIREPTAAVFRRQSGSNLLVVGQNETSAAGMLGAALLSLAARLPASGETPDDKTFQVLDFSAADASAGESLAHLAERLPISQVIGCRRQLADVIVALADEVKRRLDGDLLKEPARFLFIYGLQRARDLRPDDSFSFPTLGSDTPAGPNLSSLFTTILRDGPEVGVHTLAWCDTLTNVNRTLERRTLREFSLRVAFQMSAEDSVNLIDTPAASKLGSYRALIFDDDGGKLEKFRPYALPQEEWLAWAAGCLER